MDEKTMDQASEYASIKDPITVTRKAYQTPQLHRLGDIQTVVQGANGGSGSDTAGSSS